MNRRALWLACTALCVIAAPAAHAQSWTGAVSNDWFTAGNWSGGTVPQFGINPTTIDTMSPNSTVISGGTARSGITTAIASVAGTSGEVTVTGQGTTWSAPTLYVGNRGIGTLTVQNGGSVTSFDPYVGVEAGSTGAVTVSGAGSSWTVGNELLVGWRGNGTVAILNGGKVDSQYASVGFLPGSAGHLIISGAGSTFTTVALGIGSAGTGAVTLADSGTLTATSFVIIGPTNGALNIGAPSGTVAAAPGALNTRDIALGSGGRIVFNHTSADYTFASPISVSNGIVLVESGTTKLVANNTYTGGTIINGGTLLVNGSIASSALTSVNAGGTLGGTGTVGNTTIAGGTLAPGNSVGTLTVQGNLVLTAAAMYLVEIGATADRTNVSGAAMLGGARLTVNAPGVAGRYTILNASGGVIGTFGSVAAANHTAALSSDANNVFVDVHAALGNTTTLNQTQQTIANRISTLVNSGGALPTGFQSLFGLTGASLANALSQISGEAATGAQQTTFNAMDQFLNAMTDPFTGGRSAGLQGGAMPFANHRASAYAPTRNDRTKSEQEAFAAMARKAPLRQLTDPRWSVWGAGYGGSQSTDGNAAVGSSDVRAQVYGGAAGLDYRATPETIIGFSLGGAGMRYDLARGLGHGRSEMFQAGIYGRHQFGPGYIAGALAYAWQDVTTDRLALMSSYRANFDANAVSGRVEAGWRYGFGMSGLTPYAGAQFTTFFLPDYAEQTVAGANTFALSYASKDVTASRSELGLRADTSMLAEDAVITLRGRAAWAHNFNTDRSVSAIFQTLPASAFVVNGAAPAHDAALVSAGAEARWLNGFSVAATFEGEFSNVADSYAGKGVVRYQW